jgi:hypothetical protein
MMKPEEKSLRIEAAAALDTESNWHKLFTTSTDVSSKDCVSLPLSLSQGLRFFCVCVSGLSEIELDSSQLNCCYFVSLLCGGNLMDLVSPK